MLGFMGGPTDGSYSVQFRHMDVRYPRNVNDKDIHAYSGSTTLPLHIPTQMSYFLQKIRIGEIVRAILDSRHPGSPDVDITDYGRILALDHLFEQASRDLPPFFQSHDPIQIEKLNALEVQRVIIQLGLLSRRARLHRPFFLQADNDPQHQLSREICLQSTRTVVSLAISIIEISLNVNQLDANPASTPGPRHVADEKTRSREGLSVHRLGSVINHLSMACTALAFYAGTSSSGSNHTNSQGHGDSTADEPGPAAVRTELARACRVFTAIESESPMAAGLLRNVVSVLKRYRIQGVDTDQTLERIDHETRDSGAWEGPGLAETNPLAEPAAKVHEEMSDPVTGLNSAALSLDGLWDNFILGSAEDYTQLFADLDYYCGVT